MDLPREIRIVDPMAIRTIAAVNQRDGGTTLGRTANRMIAAFWHAGLELAPDLSAEPEPADTPTT